MKGGAKRSSISFSPITFTNLGISHQNFLTFSFNPFATLMKNSSVIPRVSPKSLNQERPSKKIGFSGQILIKLRL